MFKAFVESAISFSRESFWRPGHTSYDSVGGGTWSEANQNSFRTFFFKFYGAIPFNDDASKQAANNMFIVFLADCYMKTPSETAEAGSMGINHLLDYDLLKSDDPNSEQAKHYVHSYRTGATISSENKSAWSADRVKGLTIFMSNDVFRQWRASENLFKAEGQQSTTLRNMLMYPANMDSALNYLLMKFAGKELAPGGTTLRALPAQFLQQHPPERFPFVSHIVPWSTGRTADAQKVAAAIAESPWMKIYCLEPMNLHASAPDEFKQRGAEVLIEKLDRNKGSAVGSRGRR